MLDGTSPDSGQGDPTVGLISFNSAGTDSTAVGAIFPSISADGRYEAFESGTFAGVTFPAPSDLIAGLTVANDAPNVYVRDRQTNTATCVSVNTSGSVTGNNGSRAPIISANGRYVVFLSNATDLVAIDNNGNNPGQTQNVFVRDLVAGTTTLVSVNTTGTGPGNQESRNPSISADGRYIAYESDANNLVATDTNSLRQLTDVFVYDRQLGMTLLASKNAAGTDSGAGTSNNPVISADGSTVAFDSLANNLDPNFAFVAPFSDYQVYVRNIVTSTTTLVSDDTTRTVQGNGGSSFASLSANGRVIAFQSNATNLTTIPVTGGSIQNLFVRNLTTQAAPTLLSINHLGSAGGDSSSFAPDVSGDGSHVVFSSLANDLTTNDSGGTAFANKNVYERNLATGQTQLISINSSGTNIGNDTSDLPNATFTNTAQQDSGLVSDDGRYVIFKSRATDLVASFLKQNDPTFGYDIYRRDTKTATTTLITHQSGATSSGGNQISGTAAITPDGQYIVFQSTASNLVATDTNNGINQTDVFVSPADFGIPTPTPTPTPTPNPTPTPTPAPTPTPTPTPTAPPTPPHATGVLSVAHSKKGLTSITVGFNESLSPGSAGNRGLYSLLAGVKKHGKTVYSKVLGIRSVSYDGALAVTINLAKPFKGAVQLTVRTGVGAANGASSSTSFTKVVS